MFLSGNPFEHGWDKEQRVFNLSPKIERHKAFDQSITTKVAWEDVNLSKKKFYVNVDQRKRQGNAMLQQRRNERTLLQSRSRQLRSPNSFDCAQPPRVQTSSTSRRLINKSEWDDVSQLNNKSFNTLFSPKTIEKDANAVNTILHQQQIAKEAESWRQNWITKNRLKILDEKKNRQERIQSLEQKSGIFKVNRRPATRQLVGTSRTDMLSKPKKVYSPTNPLVGSDFRGLIHSEHPEVILRSRGVSLNHTYASPTPQSWKAQITKSSNVLITTPYEAEESVREIDDFDKKVENMRKRFPRLDLRIERSVPKINDNKA